GAADTTAVTVSGWTTAQLNYFRVYTPTAATEVGISQRHAGKWDNGKYALSITGAVNLVISVNYLHLDGLQVNTDFSNNTLTQSVNVTNINSSSSLVKISNNIVTYSNSPGACRGIFINDSQVNANINNNIIYSSSGDIGNGIEFLSSVSGNQYVYNNTISGVYTAFIGKVSSADNLVLKNNIAQCTDTSCYWYSFGTSSTNNLSNRASNAPGQNPQDSKTVSFVDSANKDFHLATSDTAAKNSGADLSADTNLAFSTDIDGETRKERWDIGADEDNNLTVEIKRGVNFKPGAKFK
ncbi:MAG TPA: hypothetical protein VK255_01390, partial [Patescibacteria group bacterium]|nr:hypothetical protein [Patescibacteria group bacterium]